MAVKPDNKAPAKYPIEELSANAEALFLVRPEVLAGALYGVAHKELSIDEAKRFVKQFLERKVD